MVIENEKTRIKKEAFTLIETLIVLGIMMLVSISVMLQMQKSAERNKAENAGERIKEIGNALQSYVSNNKAALLAAIDRGETRTIDICILTGCAVDGLPVKEILPISFTNDSLLNTGYKIALKNVDNKSIEGLVYTDSSVTLAGATDKPRYDLLGYATKAAGNAVGFSNAEGDQIDGLNGGWSIKNADLPYGGGAGILAYRTNGIDDYDGTYLRRDGSNSMTGDLLLGNNNIKNVNSMTADNYVASQNAYFQTLRTQAIYNAGDIYTDSLNAATVFAGVVNTNVVNSTNPNKDTIFGSADKNTANGNLYSGNVVANQVIAGMKMVQGNVFYPTAVVVENSPCQPGFEVAISNGAMAKDTYGRILSCQGGIWETISSGTSSGAYMFFNSGSCPDGWTPANGTNGTVDLRGNFIRGVGGNSGPLGVQQGDAIRNITGTLNSFDYDMVGTGAFYQTYVGSRWNPSGDSNSENRLMNFDASRVVPTANENRPVNVALLACMKS